MANLILRKAFESVAQHLCNLDTMRDLVEKLENETESLNSAIRSLEALHREAEVTLQTDIRILINECRHMKNGKTNR